MKRLVLGTKYWTATVEGTTLRTQFGTVGQPGQTRLKPFASAARANAARAEAVADKMSEGYRTTKTDPTKPTKAAKPTKPTKPTKPAKVDRRRDALVAIATQLGGDAVGKQVALAHDDPDAYAENYEERMDDRNLDPDDGNLAWVALADALIAKKRLVDFDWKHPAADALRGIKRLAGPAGKRAIDAILDESDALAELPMDETLEVAAGALEASNEALLALDLVSDSYEVIVVPVGDVAALVKLARTAGHQLDAIEGSSLASFVAARAKTGAKTGAKTTSKPEQADKWAALVDASMFGNVQDTLYDLRARDGALAAFRAAVPFVPAADRPLVELAVALNSASALAVARDASDPRLALRAAQFMMEHTRAQIDRRFRAVVILVRRSKLSPDPGKDHEIAALALGVDGDEAEVDAALAALPAADRELLARLGDHLFASARRGTDRMGDAIRALAAVGDATSLAALEAKGHAKAKGDLGEAVARIRARVAD